MIQFYKHYMLSIVTVFTVAMFFSCKDNYNEVQNLGISENEPIGEAENFNLKYTDSGRVTRHLIGKKMFNYTNRHFPYYEFIDGVVMNLFDKEKKKSTIVSDYAIVYDKTGIIDLQGNVEIITHNGDVLKSQQLYFDQKRKWLFTNEPVTYISGEDIIHGNGFDSNKSFSNAEVLEVTGIFSVED
ncbi:LPS export ABC transporter periplasmic protein LptC [Seonamhaeicola sp. ML3]|uniref:LPS export ABC transporter periplasmic protein LptC n=1 Tax=Seonamhaeicola sp. ML3 TaxID=2937786 RepID=UPI00200EBDB6|nr:LPS export ABC transporter periplasmic protein LptC [Seonamhaeicola sp. ML3]